MKTIIAGSRDIVDYSALEKAIGGCDWNITEVVCGGARGVDLLGERWARNNNINIEYYIPDWDKYGKSAGYIRNSLMADNAEALIAIWDNKSRGTKHMIDLAYEKGLKVYIMYVTKD